MFYKINLSSLLYWTICHYLSYCFSTKIIVAKTKYKIKVKNNNELKIQFKTFLTEINEKDDKYPYSDIDNIILHYIAILGRDYSKGFFVSYLVY